VTSVQAYFALALDIKLHAYSNAYCNANYLTLLKLSARFVQSWAWCNGVLLIALRHPYVIARSTSLLLLLLLRASNWHSSSCCVCSMTAASWPAPPICVNTSISFLYSSISCSDHTRSILRSRIIVRCQNVFVSVHSTIQYGIGINTHCLFLNITQCNYARTIWQTNEEQGMANQLQIYLNCATIGVTMQVKLADGYFRMMQKVATSLCCRDCNMRIFQSS